MFEWKLAVFDLDGVLTDTAMYHYRAWKQTLQERGIPVDDEVCELVKGISRAESLKLILKRAHVPLDEVICTQLLSEKNDRYQDMIKKLSQTDVLPGILPFLNELRMHGIVCVVASASQSASMILEKLLIRKYFAGVVDPASVRHGKPAPDIFLQACRMAHIPVEHAIGFEDARAGIQAMRRAGMKAIGIGHPQLQLEHPDVYYPDTSCLHVQAVLQALKEKSL